MTENGAEFTEEQPTLTWRPENAPEYDAFLKAPGAEPFVTKTLHDFLSLARVLADLAADRKWGNTDAVIEWLRILHLIHQAGVYGNDPRYALRDKRELRYRYINVYKEEPTIDIQHVLNQLTTANWIQSKPLQLTATGFRLAWYLRMMATESLAFYRKPLLEQTLFMLDHDEALAETYNKLGIEGPDPLAQQLFSLTRFYGDIEQSTLALVIKTAAVTQVQALQERADAVQAKVADLERDPGGRNRQQVASLQVDAAKVFGASSRVSYSTLAQVGRWAETSPQTTAEPIDIERWEEFLTALASEAFTDQPTLLSQLIDSNAPLWLPVRLEAPLSTAFLQRGYNALLSARESASTTGAPDIVFQEPAVGSPAAWQVAFGTGQQTGYDIMAGAIADKLQQQPRDVPALALLGELANGPASLVGWAMTASDMVVKKVLRPRLVEETPPEVPGVTWLSFDRRPDGSWVRRAKEVLRVALRRKGGGSSG